MKTLLMISLLTSFSAIADQGKVPVIRCLGTEPFWSVNTDAKGFLKMGQPAEGNENKFYSKTVLKNAKGTAEGFAFQIEAKDKANNTLKLNVVRAECSDGMSDNVYPFTALVDVEGDLYLGCCNEID